LTKTKVVHCKKERFDIYIGRPSVFGNPFRVGEDGDNDQCVEKFRQWIKGDAYQDIEPNRRKMILENIHLLKDRILGCWCKPYKSCHGDVLAEMADATEGKRLKS
jgi:hypothetical protein